MLITAQLLYFISYTILQENVIHTEDSLLFGRGFVSFIQSGVYFLAGIGIINLKVNDKVIFRRLTSFLPVTRPLRHG